MWGHCMVKLTNNDRIKLLQGYDQGTIKIGDKIPIMHSDIQLIIDDKIPGPEFDEIEITEKLIQECRYMFNSFIVTYEDRIECCKVPLEDDIGSNHYVEIRKHAEETAVLQIHRRGCILLGFEWEYDEFRIGKVLYATIGKVTLK